MIIGQDRSGKTSLKKSLKGEPFDPEQESTIGIEVEPCQTTTAVWKTRQAMEGTCDRNIARCTLKMFEEQQAKKETQGIIKADKGIKGPESSSQEKTTSEQENKSVSPNQPYEANRERNAVGKLGTGKVSETSHAIASDEKSADLSKKRDGINEPPKNKETKTEQASSLPEETQDLMRAEIEAKGDSDDGVELVLWDFAGQSLFYSTHALFMSRIAIYILTHNLSLKLNDKAVSLVKIGKKERELEDMCATTNMDYIHYWLSSVHALRPQSASRKPVALLVCTHADKPAAGTNPQDVAREIFSKVSGKPYASHMEEHFIVSNKLSKSEQSKDAVLKKLREAIIEVALRLPHLQEEIPLR